MNIEQQALKYLREMTGAQSAMFHDGQLEAIVELVVNNRQMLVVRKTGWGKSAVYFIATKIMRDQGKGSSIIISPLIALMRNQIESASRLGLQVATVNSSLNQYEREANERKITTGQADAIIIAPEQLANDDFVQNTLSKVLSRISLFVVDEAHCISDWGHDFRPDYRRIVRILNAMPKNLPVLATTATANNRVVSDIQSQLGDSIIISRGGLTREALRLQNVALMPKPQRLVWLLEAVRKIHGTGIIYCKTIRDCELVADWLQKHSINAHAYSGDSHVTDRIYYEKALIKNELKALVSTSALGMGFDKPDLSFVIHFQAPGNVVEYYQQVGRAGRGIDNAYGIMMQGEEDERIQSFFIERAFPTQEEIDDLLDAIAVHEGLKVSEIERYTNLSSGNIAKVLKFLSTEEPSPIFKDQSTYYRTAIDYRLPEERIARLNAIKTGEWEQLQNYSNHTGCLMQFLAQALDDPLAKDCGKCANCDPSSVLRIDVINEDVENALEFLKYRYVKIKPRKTFAKSGALAQGAFPIYKLPYKNPNWIHEEGLALSRWKDGVWGDLVADGKKKDHFSDELIAPMVQMIKSMPTDEQPRWLTYVPSPRHPNLVRNFAYKIAAALDIYCSDAVTIANTKPPQKTMENSFRRSENLDGAFTVNPSIVYSDPVLLLDDAVDSGWTFTVVSALLRKTQSGKVYPIALTSTSNQG
ncbi:ATP-dependent DNA helicase RecG [Marinomonas ushuaiensis DSM 15871]|uniref:DNA 3'-5' helicase n=1 Tax=Marinomonas ushuaiensis DSM 15871 TaxID=1122207 RepID=X7E1F4_9GAMM|nr:ATP-dependent DNA helicase RecG [Marinomonas ushuaiensis DSM 15871]